MTIWYHDGHIKGRLIFIFLKFLVACSYSGRCGPCVIYSIYCQLLLRLFSSCLGRNVVDISWVKLPCYSCEAHLTADFPPFYHLSQETILEKSKMPFPLKQLKNGYTM